MTRVLIVDDDHLVRAALTMMLDGADGLAVVGQAANGDQVPDAVAAGLFLFASLGDAGF